MRWYLRFNGYFTIENFYVPNTEQVSDGVVGNYTETDILAVRLPHSSETIGDMMIANHKTLVDEADKRIDIVIAEVKNSVDPRPNRAWRYHDAPTATAIETIERIVRFIGVLERDQVPTAAKQLLTQYRYADNYCRIRTLCSQKARTPFTSARVFRTFCSRRSLAFWFANGAHRGGIKDLASRRTIHNGSR